MTSKKREKLVDIFEIPGRDMSWRMESNTERISDSFIENSEPGMVTLILSSIGLNDHALVIRWTLFSWRCGIKSFSST